jgi:hypothetical protein
MAVNFITYNVKAYPQWGIKSKTDEFRNEL